MRCNARNQGELAVLARSRLANQRVSRRCLARVGQAVQDTTQQIQDEWPVGLIAITMYAMHRKLFFILVCAAFAGHSFHPAAARQPNLILIMADDLGYETIAANGGQSYATPNLDRMAETGMRFERCHVQPLCTPTRVQLMTGMYNIRNYASFGAIDPNATTFAHLLKKAGYATGIAGKWQLGRVKKLPQRLGFEESCLWQHTRRPPRFANPGLEYNGEERDFNRGEYGPKLVNDFALDFVTRHQDEPFFLYYPMILTHAPYQPTPDSDEWDPAAQGEKVNRRPEHFADMVAYMDKMIGRLVTKLDELKIRDDTLVIFLGDNGTGRGVESRFNGEIYPGGKGLSNARGTHVPLIANWPGRIPEGAVNRDLIDSTDFLPTLCEAAGAEIPPSPAIDGRSFLPQLLGRKGIPREWIYCWYAPSGGARPKAEFAMTADLKLYRDGRAFELDADPFEDRPLRVDAVSSHAADDAKMLQAALQQYAHARPNELKTAVARSGKNNRPGDRASKGERAKKRAERRKNQQRQS
jgi:arylsulfatase A